MRMRHCGVIPFRSGITRGSLHPRNRKSRKKTCIYFAFSSLLDFLRLAVIRLTFFFFRSVPGVFPHLIYGFFSAPNSPTFFFFVFLYLCLFSYLSIGFIPCLFAESATRCFMLIRWLHLDARLLSCFHFEN